MITSIVLGCTQNRKSYHLIIIVLNKTEEEVLNYNIYYNRKQRE